MKRLLVQVVLRIKPVHMDWKQATYTARIKPKAVIPMYYGSMVGKKTDGLAFKKELETLDSSIRVELKL